MGIGVGHRLGDLLVIRVGITVVVAGFHGFGLCEM